jgi:hypothetical protein
VGEAYAARHTRDERYCNTRGILVNRATSGQPGKTRRAAKRFHHK